MFVRLRLSVALVVVVAWFGNGCIYAPLDLGLDKLGQLVEATVVDGASDDKILLVRVDGEITGQSTAGSLFGAEPPTTSSIRDVLDVARQDEAVKAIILRVNSPGGGVTASDMVYRELSRYREETGHPIVAFFLDTAASGGYYIAQAADHIVAAPTCVTGSIGVIAWFPNVSGLGQKIGVDVHTITSGRNKDLGNPFRPMAPAERQLLQGVIDGMYEQFVNTVTKGRTKKGLSHEQVKKLADGRVYTAEQAKKAGLVDEVGYFENAFARASKLANLREAKVVTYERRVLGGNRPTIYSEQPSASALMPVTHPAASAPGDVNLIKVSPMPSLGAHGPVFQYLWSPGM